MTKKNHKNVKVYVPNTCLQHGGTLKKKLQYKNYPTKPKIEFHLVCHVFHFPPQKWFHRCLVEHNNLIHSTPVTDERHDGLAHIM
jgi:hypothetical protein